MHEKDAKKFIKSYCKLCSLLETNDVNVLCRSLGLPLQDVSTSHELQNADQKAHDWQAAQWHGDDEPQDNKQCSESVLGCPWPECDYMNLEKYSLSIHFLTVHLNCGLAMPRKRL